MPSPPSHPLRVSGVVLVLGLALLATGLVSPSRAAAADTCTTTANGGAYTVSLCLTAPGGALTGEVPLSATVSVTASDGVVAPGVEKVVFSFSGQYLLADHDPAYGMRWRTDRIPDQRGPLEAKVRLTDAFEARTTTTATLANGVTIPTPNTRTFSVARGTTPSPGQPFRLAAVGDGVDGSDRETAVADQIESWSPNLLAYLGDVYERGSQFEYDNWYSAPAGYGRFRAITNPVVGNHEYFTPGAAGYFDYWDNVPHYYSYDVAGWHLVALDTTDDFNQLRPGTAQYDWLAADLGANRSRCTIVYMHHPRYSVSAGGGRAGLTQVWSLLAARRVTLALAGHAHSYERWTPMDGSGVPAAGGVTQLVAGAGGHEVVPASLSDTRLASSAAELGAIRLDLGPDSASFAYVRADGEVKDAGTIGCTSTGDPLPPTTPAGLLASATASTTAALSWQPSSDQYTSVAGYTVRRNGVPVATLDGSITTYVDSGLTTGTTYSWTVDAFDPSGNYSPQSAPASATTPAPPVPTLSTRVMLRQLVRAPERPRGFKRSKFRMWTDADGDGCSTRNEVLLPEAVRPPTVLPGCGLAGGRWFSRYDGVTTSDRSRLRIEHVVPLAEVWRSGARRWTKRTRQTMANDLGYQHTLSVATKKVLRSRGAAEPQSWMPPRRAARCGYVAQWVAVKWRWRLRLDGEERRFLAKRLARCGWPVVVKPVRPPVVRR